MTKEINLGQIILGLFTFCLSYLIYYMSINSVYTFILYLHASSNPNYVTDDYNSIGFQVIIYFVSFFYFMNFLLTLIIAYKISFHILSINISIHKYLLVYLYLVLDQITCEDNTYLNCDENIDNTIIDIAKICIIYGIYIFIISELLSIGCSRFNKYYFSPNLFKEIILSFLFYNLISLLYISIIFLICCVIAGAGAGDGDGNGNGNGFDLNKINNGFNRMSNIQTQVGGGIDASMEV